MWVGVDVGARRKGFDVALVDRRGLHRLLGGLSRDGVLEVVADSRPVLVGIDSPKRCAPSGFTARDCELALARAVCGIRWTPDLRRVKASPYYAWVVEGLELFAALAAGGWETIEVFPTASWTRWIGPRGPRRRADWSRHGLSTLGLAGMPGRTNQDQRDAIAAAVTARQHTDGATERFGDIVVPRVAVAGRTTRPRSAGP